MRRFALAALVLTLALGSTLAAQKFTSVWKAPDVGTLGFAGKKVVALLMVEDPGIQVGGEEALVRELTLRGVNGVAAYRMIPKEELRDRDKAKAWFTRSKVEGAVIMRVLGSEKETIVQPSMWVTTSYSTLWSYWGYGWTSVYVPGSSKQTTIVTIETLIFDVAKDKLVWAGVSEKTNPKGVQRTVNELVAGVIVEMKKDGLVPKEAK
jgi:hypothetical protein